LLIILMNYFFAQKYNQFFWLGNVIELEEFLFGRVKPYSVVQYLSITFFDQQAVFELFQSINTQLVSMAFLLEAEHGLGAGPSHFTYAIIWKPDFWPAVRSRRAKSPVIRLIEKPPGLGLTVLTIIIGQKVNPDFTGLTQIPDPDFFPGHI